MKKITKALSLVMIRTLCIFTLTAGGGSDDANAGADTEKAVSYTHLDVYKRQRHDGLQKGIGRS